MILFACKIINLVEFGSHAQYLVDCEYCSPVVNFYVTGKAVVKRGTRVAMSDS